MAATSFKDYDPSVQERVLQQYEREAQGKKGSILDDRESRAALLALKNETGFNRSLVGFGNPAVSPNLQKAQSATPQNQKSQASNLAPLGMSSASGAGGKFQGPIRPGTNERTFRETGKSEALFQGPVSPNFDVSTFRETGRSVAVTPQAASQAAQDKSLAITKANVDAQRNALQRDANYILNTNDGEDSFQYSSPIGPTRPTAQNNFSTLLNSNANQGGFSSAFSGSSPKGSNVSMVERDPNIIPAFEFGNFSIGSFNKSNSIPTKTSFKSGIATNVTNNNLQDQYFNLSNTIQSDPYKFANQSGVSRIDNESGTFFSFNSTFIDNNINRTYADDLGKAAGKSAFKNLSFIDRFTLSNSDRFVNVGKAALAVGEFGATLALNVNPTIKSADDLSIFGKSAKFNTVVSSSQSSKFEGAAILVGVGALGGVGAVKSIKSIGFSETAANVASGLLPIQAKTGVFAPTLTESSLGKGVAIKKGDIRFSSIKYDAEGIVTRDFQNILSPGKGVGTQVQETPFARISGGGSNIEFGTRTTKSIYNFENIGKGSGFPVESKIGYVDGKALAFEKVGKNSFPAGETRTNAYVFQDTFKLDSGKTILATQFLNPLKQTSTSGSISKNKDPFTLYKSGRTQDTYSVVSNEFKRTFKPNVDILEFNVPSQSKPSTGGGFSSNKDPFKITSLGDKPSSNGFKVITPSAPKVDSGNKGLFVDLGKSNLKTILKTESSFVQSGPLVQVKVPKIDAFSSSPKEVGGVFTSLGQFSGRGIYEQSFQGGARSFLINAAPRSNIGNQFNSPVVFQNLGIATVSTQTRQSAQGLGLIPQTRINSNVQALALSPVQLFKPTLGTQLGFRQFQDQGFSNRGFSFSDFGFGSGFGNRFAGPDFPSLGGYAFSGGRGPGRKSNVFNIAPSFSAIVQNTKISAPIKVSRTFGVNPFQTRGLLTGKASRGSYFKFTDF